MSLKKSIVLLSGGLDSTVNFYKASIETEVILALTFNYGQRAAAREIEASYKIAHTKGIKHQVIELNWLAEITETALVNYEKEIPKLRVDELDDTFGAAKTSAEAVWVPNRNGIFINIAAAFAESFEARCIVTGFNIEEGATFPDNSPAFVDTVNKCLKFSTLYKPEVISYTSKLNKKEIALLGKKLNIPFNLIWSCYFGGAEMCGECESCLRLNRAMEGI